MKVGSDSSDVEATGLGNTVGLTQKKRSGALPPPPVEAIFAALDCQQASIDWLAGDGSDRCYYRIRVNGGGSFVLMQLSDHDARALRDNGYDWISIGELLSANEVFVPRLVKALPEFAALIIEDYGDIMLESRVHELFAKGDVKEISRLYEKASKIISRFVQIPAAKGGVWTERAFDADRFVWEMNFFRENYLEPVCGIHFNKAEEKAFLLESQALSRFLASFSKWFVHRDFHSRNLMYKDDRLATIDFQDARFGPSAYDLVSLCFDSYVPATLDVRLRWLGQALEILRQDMGPGFVAELESHWQPMLLQRQLKAIGSFGYLSLKKNRGNYLKYVTPALATLDESLVFDKRWPFLSKAMIQAIKNVVAYDV